MNIPQIRYFVTAAQLQNLSKAADSLHLSQPSLSKSISKLEEELGTPLFERRGKRVVLNEAGERFLTSARAMLRTLDDTLLDLSELSAGDAARLTVGLFESDHLLSDCLVSFARTCPQVNYDLRCGIEGEELPDINRYDMLLYPDENRYRKFRGVFLRDEPYFLAVNAAHPLADRPAVLPQELSGESFVFLNRDKTYIEEPYYLCTGLNLRLRVRCLTDDREQHRQLIAAGLALGFVPEGCAVRYRADRHIRLVRISNAKFSRRMMVCFKRTKHLTALGRTFRSFVLDYFALPDPEKPASGST